MGNGAQYREMNPHWLFLGILALSLIAALVYLNDAAQIENASNMVLILGMTSAIVGVTLILTMKYWRDARRLV